jgi:hypothetical protein
MDFLGLVLVWIGVRHIFSEFWLCRFMFGHVSSRFSLGVCLGVGVGVGVCVCICVCVCLHLFLFAMS